MTFPRKRPNIFGSMAASHQFIGQTLSHYRIIEQLGAGGMGVVFRAHDERLDRDVALKLLPAGSIADENARKRFRTEARALSRLNHPNIATVYEFDTENGVDFIVMELVPGKGLDESVAGGAVPEKEIVGWGIQLAEGLMAAHDKGVLHRDLKPANLRLTPDGRLKILDFGLAKLLHPVNETAPTLSLGETESLAGTLPYMAPEQLKGEEVDARCDIYAAGTVLYELATGRRPFQSRVLTALINNILHEAPAPPERRNAAISSRLTEIILKCLEKEPENRYQSAKELAVDLRRASPAISRIQPRARRPRRSVAVMGATSLVLALVLGFTVARFRQRLPAGSAGQIKSLAVLPLENLSRDPEQEYFADGMTEQLISTLSRIGSLRVISRTSVMRYKQGNKPLPAIARELKVDSVIEGAVLRSGNRVRVTAQLVRAADDRSLWGATYDRDLRDVFALQSDIAQAVADEIQLRLTPQERGSLSARGAVSPEAHDAYLKGRYYWNQRTEQSLYQALRYFQEVTAREPNWAFGYVGLADCYNLLPYYANLPLKQTLMQAKEAARKAVALDDGLAEAHASLSFALMYGDWNLPAAEQELKRATALNPNYATAHLWYAGFLTRTGKLPQALAEIRRAQQLDPLSPFIVSQVGFILYYMGEYEAALAQLEQALELDPSYWVTHMDLGMLYEQQGRFEKALPELEKAVLLSKGSATTVAALGHVYASAGAKDKALQQLRRLDQQARQGYVSPYLRAVIYAGLGEQDKAFAELEKAYDKGDEVFDLGVDPWFNNLRADPRYKRLLGRIGLPS